MTMSQHDNATPGKVVDWIHKFLGEHFDRFRVGGGWPEVGTHAFVVYAGDWIEELAGIGATLDEARRASRRMRLTPPAFRDAHLPRVLAEIASERVAARRAAEQRPAPVEPERPLSEAEERRGLEAIIRDFSPDNPVVLWARRKLAALNGEPIPPRPNINKVLRDIATKTNVRRALAEPAPFVSAPPTPAQLRRKEVIAEQIETLKSSRDDGPDF